MQILYHHQLCPLSRQIRVLLKELNISHTTIREDYWLRRNEFIQKNPLGTVPVLEVNEKIIIVGNYSIIEYLNDTCDDFYFMPEDILTRAEVRKYISRFNDKFYRDVTKVLTDEKMIRLLMRAGEPRSNYIRAAKENLTRHLYFMDDILKTQSFIVSDKISCADIVAAAHLSVVDYFGEINWDGWEAIKNWYSVIKSRPSFQPILLDRIPGFNPPKYYSNLDF